MDERKKAELFKKFNEYLDRVSEEKLTAEESERLSKSETEIEFILIKISILLARTDKRLQESIEMKDRLLAEIKERLVKMKERAEIHKAIRMAEKDKKNTPSN